MYDEVLRQGNLAIHRSQHKGECLVALANISSNTLIFEDSPLISYLLPARHFVDEEYCMNCFCELTASVAKCEHCCFRYCSDECKQHHFLSHYGLCAGLNNGEKSKIEELHSETESISGYAIAEVICEICAKIAIKMCQSLAFQDAYNEVMEPYFFLMHSSDISVDFPVKSQYKYTELVLSEVGRNLPFVADIEFIINKMLNYDFYKFIVSIIALNSCGVVINNEEVGIAVYNIASKMNHSCVPNCKFYWEKDYLLEVLSEKNIPENEELTISYIPLDLPLNERESTLKEGWNFVCNCQLCAMQEKSDLK